MCAPKKCDEHDEGERGFVDLRSTNFSIAILVWKEGRKIRVSSVRMEFSNCLSTLVSWVSIIVDGTARISRGDRFETRGGSKSGGSFSRREERNAKWPISVNDYFARQMNFIHLCSTFIDDLAYRDRDVNSR